VTAKGYARRRTANVNGLTFRRISDPGFVPTPKSPAASFDDLVGRGHQRRRSGEAEDLRGLQDAAALASRKDLLWRGLRLEWTFRPFDFRFHGWDNPTRPGFVRSAARRWCLPSRPAVRVRASSSASNAPAPTPSNPMRFNGSRVSCSPRNNSAWPAPAESLSSQVDIPGSRFGVCRAPLMGGRMSWNTRE
jgi:hypothetical protein